MTDLLFVCTANICRSAYAEVRTAMLAPALSVGSAGVQGWVDKAMDAPMAAELTARGGDPSAFRSRRLTIPMLRGARLVLTAEARHRSVILDDLPATHARAFTLGLAALSGRRRCGGDGSSPGGVPAFGGRPPRHPRPTDAAEAAAEPQPHRRASRRCCHLT
jgi:protein-tyrosine-phosphatase